jgi:hypothetical protein
MKTKTLLASIAVAGLVVAQPVSAATRSADSVPQTGVQSADAADRIGSITGESEDAIRGRPLLILLLLFGGLAALLLALSGGKSNG